MLIGVKLSQMKDELFYTPEEVSKKLKVSYMTIYRWIVSNKLSAYKLGRQYRISENSLNNFLNLRKNEK